MAIYSLLKNSTNHITLKILGCANSIASVIVQAADHRTMDKHAEFMLHDGSDSVSDDSMRNIERRAEALKVDRERMYGIFAERTGKDKAYFRRKLAHDWYLTAEQAIKEGLIDEVV